MAPRRQLVQSVYSLSQNTIAYPKELDVSNSGWAAPILLLLLIVSSHFPVSAEENNVVVVFLEYVIVNKFALV